MEQRPLGLSKNNWPSSINFPLTLAPMVGLSHCAFRQLLRSYLPQGAQCLWPSEMLNSRRLPDENLPQIPEAMCLGDESFWMPQILANDEVKIQRSLEKLYQHGAQGIDINMGCPVQKALKHNYGVALMGDVDYAAQVVAATVRHSPGPVSVKLRGAHPDKKQEWLHFSRSLYEAGASWLCLHPRTPEQKRKGSAQWESIKDLVNHLPIPVIGNGDVQVVDDVFAMIEQTGCDMVMAGRALTARPWLFWQLGEKLGWPNPPGRNGTAPRTPIEEGQEYARSLLELWSIMQDVFPERLAWRKFLFHVKTGSVWLIYGHHLHSRLTALKSTNDITGVIEDFFSTDQPMSAKTQLRQ
jgi:tRNA-dihydrouridine synthase B